MRDNYAADEGRDFLATVIWGDACEWSPDDLEEMDDDYIENWLAELGYDWDGASWKAT